MFVLHEFRKYISCDGMLELWVVKTLIGLFSVIAKISISATSQVEQNFVSGGKL